MVNREQFEEICNKYGLDSKKLIKNNEKLLIFQNVSMQEKY